MDLAAAAFLLVSIWTVSLGLGLDAALGSGLVLSLLSVLAGAGLLVALALLTSFSSDLALARALGAPLPLDSGLAGAFSDLLTGFAGVLGIASVGALAAGLALGLGRVVLDLVTFFWVGLAPVLLGLGWDFEALSGTASVAMGLPSLTPLALGLRADSLGVEVAFCRRLALRTGVLALAGVLSCCLVAVLLGDFAFVLLVTALLPTGLT
ncbi:hypothetical protein [Meiothermus sp. CFH 77666]|uniref:hypothetical protein n=1 Tax=Meiothermus sp. CFH 77666 TaxID=2817942 RepID=UPI001AA06CDD|nr:hypothetical protein [Meiothermus sp. CFH 77666]MBO1437738.1 hypothetical protein [Meiothermus sp. CFH 77666]